MDNVNFTHHVNNFWINWIGENTTIRRQVLDGLVECRTFDLLPLEVTQRVVDKVKHHGTLTNLLQEQGLPFRRRRI